MTLDAEIIASIIGTLLTALTAGVGFLLRRLVTDVRRLLVDLAVIKSKISDALILKEIVNKTRDTIVRLDQKLEMIELSHKKDLDAFHNAKRDIYRQLGGH
jgi:hypothetical protein